MYVAEHDIDTASARKKHYERPQNKLRGLTANRKVKKLGSE